MDFRDISYLGFSIKFVETFPLRLKPNKNNTDYMKTYVHLWDCFLQWRLFFEVRTEANEARDELNVSAFMR